MREGGSFSPPSIFLLQFCACSYCEIVEKLLILQSNIIDVLLINYIRAIFEKIFHISVSFLWNKRKKRL